MKRMLPILVLLLLFSCSNSDDGNPNLDVALNGTWILTNVSCFCAFPNDPSFERTRLIFDTDSNEITVQQDESLLDYFRPEGVYTYQIEENSIVLEDGRAYNYTIEENQLFLDFIDEPLLADDEIFYTLRRN